MESDHFPSGPFSVDELGSVSDLDPMVSGGEELRFFRNCMNYYREWLSATKNDVGSVPVPLTQAAIFIFSETPRVVPGLPEELLVESGRVWKKALSFCSGVAICNENLEVMIRLCQGVDDIDKAFEFVDRYLSADHSFVIVPFSQKRILVHHSGVNIQEWLNSCHEVKVSTDDIEITPEVISSEINEFHKEHTEKPGGHVARFLWDNTFSSPKLATAPESRIQSGMVLYFQGRFKSAGAVIDEEVKVPGGRSDIRITRLSKFGDRRNVNTVLELKILSPDRSDQKNYTWAESGIAQADRYRNSSTDAAFACIFDARRAKEWKMEDLNAEADKKSVLLRKYEMEIPPVKPKPKPKPKPKAKAKAKAKAKTENDNSQ